MTDAGAATNPSRRLRRVIFSPDWTLCSRLHITGHPLHRGRRAVSRLSGLACVTVVWRSFAGRAWWAFIRSTPRGDSRSSEAAAAATGSRYHSASRTTSRTAGRARTPPLSPRAPRASIDPTKCTSRPCSRSPCSRRSPPPPALSVLHQVSASSEILHHQHELFWRSATLISPIAFAKSAFSSAAILQQGFSYVCVVCVL